MGVIGKINARQIKIVKLLHLLFPHNLVSLTLSPVNIKHVPLDAASLQNDEVTNDDPTSLIQFVVS
jgi:hypothetical protein